MYLNLSTNNVDNIFGASIHHFGVAAMLNTY